jgi:hypothetical protein
MESTRRAVKVVVSTARSELIPVLVAAMVVR